MTLRIDTIKQPSLDNPHKKTMLTDETLQERKQKVLIAMNRQNISTLVIYADKEHGSNFEYLAGFIPRFEEALLIMTIEGHISYVLGNENANKASKARLTGKGIKCPVFSLPNQPMAQDKVLTDYLEEATWNTEGKVGLVGWKLLPASMQQTFDVPFMIVEALQAIVGNQRMINATGLMIDPAYGVRTTNNANELVHYEYGASLASDNLLNAMNHLAVGMSEFEVGHLLQSKGQYPTIVTISAFGERFEKANLYPTERKLSSGDKVALTVAYKGGLSSRCGYAVHSLEELEETDPGYLDEVVKPYMNAYFMWLEMIKIGTNGHDFYQTFDANYSKETYGWHLCPGHLVADEEWLSSPFFFGSKATVKNGMIFQIDFIPSQTYHHGVSAESTIAIADETLRKELQNTYPDFWKRVINRRVYIEEELGVQLSEEVVPLASTVGYLRPLMLDYTSAVTKK
ncbi:M24 family metallopeptidase [Vagococcus xieshaowenii]|uniref:Xaa-Pro aminopeptidase n=1 Tax=Vagococcus xieshaowenii TaxID=2562451 RepID=A0A4Z0D707_9ENTE|nr:M24 family metallopeptidase [Vagococcus xieshaowenii]QCA28538.1 Xaa-Pro aminopeptidase [Vagococcus xieshaowenii]TFZ40654.1 Xaa-Pro aminopeptidase [Vagococcus xieshaowenii]